jgi:monothiol glutaredoxin
MDPLERIKEFVESNPVALFIKGTPQMPMCGFSSRTAEALKSCEREFAWCNVIADPEIFENLPRYADWPTFPQLYIEGELVGGCDITIEMATSGELKKMVQAAVDKAA